jgi:hypothetical protein
MDTAEDLRHGCPEIYQSPGLVVVSEFLTAILQSMEDISWTKGRHNMRFEGQFTYIQLNEAYGAQAWNNLVQPCQPVPRYEGTDRFPKGRRNLMV